MVWLLALPVVWWAAVLIADSIHPNQNLPEILEVLTERLNHPFALHLTEYTAKAVLICTFLYAMGIGIYFSTRRNYRRREEHGSAKWGNTGL